MNTKETLDNYLNGIADSIRYVEESNDIIPASEFENRIKSFKNNENNKYYIIIAHVNQVEYYQIPSSQITLIATHEDGDIVTPKIYMNNGYSNTNVSTYNNQDASSSESYIYDIVFYLNKTGEWTISGGSRKDPDKSSKGDLNISPNYVINLNPNALSSDLTSGRLISLTGSIKGEPSSGTSGS